MDHELVIPSDIPWDRLKGADLEECLYWLLEDMGAKDLEWRKGGEGGGAADQGRDLEASFYTPAPDGDLFRQRWWVEAKGRTGTVELLAVQKAVFNAQGRKDIDLVVVATNTQFSNPTRDWVSKFQETNPRPLIRLWERSHLERMIVRHPSVVVRLFAESLSEQGRLEVIRSRFWNHVQFASTKDLERLWGIRQDLEITSETILALIASEIANGDLHIRPWPLTVDKTDLAPTLTLAMVNIFSLCHKAEQVGVGQQPVIGLTANLLMVALVELSLDSAVQIVQNAWSLMKDGTHPLELGTLTEPILSYVKNELSVACVQDCKRVSVDTDEENDEPVYWDRFQLPIKKSPSERKNRPFILVIEHIDKPCNVGFELNATRLCPLFKPDKNATLREHLSNFRQVLIARTNRPLIHKAMDNDGDSH